MDVQNKRIRLYGAGGHSQVIKDVADNIGYDIVEVFDDHPFNTNYWESGTIRPGLMINPDFPHEGDAFIIAIGDNRTRALLAQKLKSRFETIVHPSAIVSKEAIIGTGTVIYAGAVIQPNTRIGEHVIINTSASVDHDNVIGNFAHISPKAALTGHVEVGEGSFVGAGAVIIPKIKIGKWCIIGAGTVIIKDVPDYAVVVGNPGKIIKYQKPFQK
ncbi:acetyltransferase [Flagellimonas aequoris]|uniref:Acetyltransferase n=1 Tax=Flagellimonas aequoris TaxID=2306997 RepID=A0A418NC58_9FLAO|nr:acetyltransferase [Allomuricauda aequoris]TXK08596.1 acetyltransferase [Allomuricauda aequoris]